MKTTSHPVPSLLLTLVAIATLAAGCNSLSRRTARQTVIPPNFAPTPVVEIASVDPVLLQRPNFEYRLGPGDVVDIEMLGDVNTQTTSVVGPDGKIYFYLLPGIDVWGLTINQARQRLMQGMQTLVREQQPVSVTLRKSESQRLWILGRLNKPGIYSMTGPMTLLDALSEAGGPAPAANAFSALARPTAAGYSRGTADDAADLKRAFIIRDGHSLRVDFNRLLREGDMSQNIYLQPNDFVYLPSETIGNVHVLGAVQSPRAVDYVNQLTLLQALAQAGGPLRRDAHLSQVAIVRGSLSQPRVATVDVSAILAGQAPDIALEPQDIVFVPEGPYRVLTRYVDMILDTFVRTVGVNEGAKAVNGQAQFGVTVPLGPL
jgi:protein involved in polysaccharide export with SLBB domain